VVRRGVAVEKLAQREFSEIASRQEALGTIFPSLLDIFYHPIFDFFKKNRGFQQPRDFSTSIQPFMLKTSGLDVTRKLYPMAEKLFIVYLNGALDPIDPAYIQPVRASKVEQADGRLVFTHSDGTFSAFFDVSAVRSWSEAEDLLN
jgi:hypothetical protein